MQIRIRITNPLAVNGVAPASVDASTASKPAASNTLTSGSSRVALGILISRISGLARERVIGHYFGLNSIVADAFRASIRIPNLLNNLFGEGVLSASFVTVYAKLRALERPKEAQDLAAAVFSLLALVSSILVLAGVTLTPWLIDLVVPGSNGETRALAIRLVRILFPFTGLLVLSAWCLGVLNSHRKFLLSYLAPVSLNITVIVVAIIAGRQVAEDRLVITIAWAFVLGAAIQFLVQLPPVLNLLPGFQPDFHWRRPHVRSVLHNFGPIFLSRGVVQISSYIDSMIASFLPTGAIAAFGYSQVISVLPISLFSMSVSAAELPMLSSAVGTDLEIAAFLRRRLAAGLRRIAFFIVPSAVAFLLLGDIIAAALYQTGKFKHADAVDLWGVLAGSAVGLLATALGRLYSSTFYAVLDTRTPLRFAVIRVVLTTMLGFLFAIPLPRWLGIEQKWGVAGLTISAGIAGWLEFALLRHALTKRIGNIGLDPVFTTKLWFAAFAAGILAYGVKLLLGAAHPLLLACVALPLYGAVYFAGTFYLHIPEARKTLSPFAARLGIRL